MSELLPTFQGIQFQQTPGSLATTAGELRCQRPTHDEFKSRRTCGPMLAERRHMVHIWSRLFGWPRLRGDTVGHHESHFLHRSVGADCNCDHRRHAALLQINPGNAETPAAASLPLQRNRTASSRANASHTIVTRSSIAAIGLSKTAAIPTSSSPVPSPVPSMAAPFVYLASEVRAQITMTIVTPNRSIYMLRRWVVFVLWSVTAPTLSVPVRSNALTETEAI